MRLRILGLSAATIVVLAGCGGGRGVPAARVGLGVPYGYRATHVWRANLSGQAVPDVIVASVGPAVSGMNFHSADIRVLVWDPLADQWTVAFDAQRVLMQQAVGDPGSNNYGPGVYAYPNKPMPLIDPKADVILGPVRFVSFLPGPRRQLAFSAQSNYGGSGEPAMFTLVDFKGGLAQVTYTWNGEGLGPWSVANHVLTAHAHYWTWADAHCCPVGDYTFTVAKQKGFVTETSDSRPWLGVAVHATTVSQGFMGPIRVTGFADNSPAKGRLRAGDVILAVLNKVKPPKGFDGSAIRSIFDKLILLHPGDTARLLVDRGGARMTVPVRLGSMIESTGQYLSAKDVFAAAL